MTHKVIRKISAILVCIAMLLGLFPISRTGNNVYAAAQEVSITNSGFEDAVTIPGWEALYNADSLSVSDAVYHSGSKSLKVIDTGSTQSPAIYSSHIPVKKGDIISSKFFANVNNHNTSSALLVMYQFQIFDAYGASLGYTKSLDIEKATGDAWSEYTTADAAVTFDGAASARVMISGGGGAQVQAYFDDVTVINNGVEVSLENAGFEDAVTVPGWEALYNADSLSVSDAVYHSGSKSLKVIDTGSTQSPAIYSSHIPVKKGDIISSKFFANVNNHNTSSALLVMYQFQIFDVNGKSLGYTKSLDIEAATGKEWKEYTTANAEVTFDGAASARVMISGGGGAQVQAYFDDITILNDSLQVDPPFVPVEYSNTIVETDCSSLLAMKEAKWAIDQGTDGLYLNDKDNTLGSEATMKSVDAGQILFYQDNTPGLESINAFIYSDMDNKIENNAWNLKLRMNIADIMQMNNYNDVRSGFSFLVFTGTRLTRLNFCADNKLRLQINEDSSQPPIAVDANLPMDGNMHDWMISKINENKLYVTCDNVVVAQFDTDGYAYAGDQWTSPGLQFINYCSSAYKSGNTEVYFDDIKLTSDAPDNFVPQEYTNTIVETDCSSLKAMSDAKWSIDPGADGAYVNDRDNTLGSTITMKPAEEGKILLYHDGTPGVNYIYAFKYGDMDNKIGDNAWTLKLNMNISEIMKFKNYNDPRSGLSFLVFTGTRLTRLTFCVDNKLLLNTGSETTPSISCNANIPMDGAYHNWMISKTAEGKLYITCDGSVVGKFETDGYAYPGDDWTAPGVQILTYCSGDYDTGKTEVSFDDIRLTSEAAAELINLDFELPQNTDGTIPGWNQWYGKVGFTETTEDKNSGNQSLLVNDDKTDTSFWLLSNTLPVVAGDNYELGGSVKVLSGSVQVNVAYLDENDNMVKYYENEISSPANQWVATKTSGIAPAGAKKVCIFVYSGLGATGKAYVDDLTLTKVINQGIGIKTGTPVNLGEMVKGRALDLYSIVANNEATGQDELYTVSTGASDNPSVFYVLDPYTGKVKWSQPLQGTTHLYGIVRGSDKNIYFAGTNDGILYRYLPAEQKIENIGTNPCYPWVWDMAASKDGKIYGATSGDTSLKIYSKIFEYDIAADTFKDLGPAKDGVKDARGLGVTDDYIYVGVGTPDAVVKIDRKTMEKTEITTGATGDPERMGAHIWSYNGRLFIRDCAMRLYVMDEATGEQLNLLSFQQAISAPSPYDSNILYYKSKNEVWEYHFDTNMANAVVGGPRLSDATSNALNWFTPTSGEKAGRHLLGITDDSGGYVVYDPVDKTATDVVLEMIPQAVEIVSLENSPDGKLYIGGYQYGSCIYDPNTQKIERVEAEMHQPEGIGFLNGKTYYGTYGSAVIYSYDPSKPYSFNPVGPGNPGIAHDIESKQDRPFVLASGDNKLFVGTIPDYGLLGGALTVYDEQAGAWEEYRNVVQDQSITGLAYKDGLLYGSTSIDGGLGSTRTAEEAKIFVWDVAKKEKINEVSISIPGMAAKPILIGSLSFGPDGLLWGAVDGALFAMNPDTFEIVKSRIICSMDYAHDNSWRPFFLHWGADGLLYTTVGRKIVVFDTSAEDLPYEILAKSFLGTLGNDGNVYYTDGSSLMMLPIIRNTEDAAYKKNVAINTAENAIDMLPGYYNLTLANKSSVEAARASVNAAIAAGAVEAAIDNLGKLAKCEARISELDSGTTEPTPTPAPSPVPDNTIIKAPEMTGDVATASVTAGELDKAFDAAEAGIDGIRKVAIEVSKAEGAKEYVQKLPAGFFETAGGKKNIEISSPVGTITVSDKMFEKENIKKAENVAISIRTADLANADKKVKDTVGDRPVVEINAMIDGKNISWKNPAAPVLVSIAYTPSAEELKAPEHITVYYIDGHGKLISVPNGKYNEKTGTVTFTVTHFSKYAISFVKKTFNDIAGSSAKREIEVLASKGIINGTSALTFSPRSAISRADFLVLLIKALDLNTEFDGNFSDIKSSAYYFQAVGTAKKLGITKGCGNNLFNPNETISRKDMLVLAERALKAAGKGTLALEASGNAAREDAALIIYNIYNK